MRKLLISILLISSLSLSAQVDTSIMEDLARYTKHELHSIKALTRIPILNEHRFIPNRIVESAFLSTMIRLEGGIGTTTSENFVAVPITDSISVDLEGKLTFANVQFNYDQRLQRNMLFYLNAGAILRVGSNTEGLLIQGLNTLSFVQIGWKIRVFSNDKHYLSTSFGLNNYNAAYSNVFKYLLDLIDGEEGAQLTQNVNALQGNIELNYAYGINSMLGFQFSGGYGYGDSFEKGATTNRYLFGGAFDLNLYPKTKAPIGFSLGYSYGSLPNITELDESPRSIYNFSIAYTGTTSLILFLDVTAFESRDAFATVGDVKISTFVSTAELNMVFYF